MAGKFRPKPAMKNRHIHTCSLIAADAETQGAVIKETLRVSAIVSSRLPLMPREELLFHDWNIPANVSIQLNAYSWP